MKKIIALAGLLVLTLAITGFAVWQPYTSVTPKAETIFASADTATPEGMERATFVITSDELGQAVWQKTYGNLDGYTLEGANNVAIFVKAGTIPDCKCNDPEPEFRLKPKYGSPLCTDCYGEQGEEACQK